jgi:catechol 2,3-dioxygenase-like lactoylglutathione lyase family enzyme
MSALRITGFEFWLPSLDLKGSLEFYVGHLGFRKVWDFEAYCTVSYGNVRLAFRPTGSPDLIKQFQGESGLLCLEVSGIHGYYEKLKAAGVVIEHELELMAPGVWQFSVKDNNGYYIGFNESAGDVQRIVKK